MDRNSQTEFGKTFDKTGGAAAAGASFGLDALSRAATGPGTTTLSELTHRYALPAFDGTGAAAEQLLLRQASKNADILAFPEKPQRAFIDDYKPASAKPEVASPGAFGEPLAVTMDGHPLVAEAVAGRRTVGGPDVALTPDEIAVLASRLVGEVRPAMAGEIGHDAGRHVRQRGQGGPLRSILFSPNLGPSTTERVIAHETGHAIDDAVRNLDIVGQVKNARQLDNTGNNINRERVSGKVLGDAAGWARPIGPEHSGYRAREAGGELTAELYRAYLENRDYVKGRHPDLAARMRGAVNANARLNGFIQFNANPRTSGVPGLLAIQAPAGAARASRPSPARESKRGNRLPIRARTTSRAGSPSTS